MNVNSHNAGIQGHSGANEDIAKPKGKSAQLPENSDKSMDSGAAIEVENRRSFHDGTKKFLQFSERSFGQWIPHGELALFALPAPSRELQILARDLERAILPLPMASAVHDALVKTSTPEDSKSLDEESAGKTVALPKLPAEIWLQIECLVIACEDEGKSVGGSKQLKTYQELIRPYKKALALAKVDWERRLRLAPMLDEMRFNVAKFRALHFTRRFADPIVELPYLNTLSEEVSPELKNELEHGSIRLLSQEQSRKESFSIRGTVSHRNIVLALHIRGVTERYQEAGNGAHIENYRKYFSQFHSHIESLTDKHQRVAPLEELLVPSNYKSSYDAQTLRLGGNMHLAEMARALRPYNIPRPISASPATEFTKVSIGMLECWDEMILDLPMELQPNLDGRLSRCLSAMAPSEAVTALSEKVRNRALGNFNQLRQDAASPDAENDNRATLLHAAIDCIFAIDGRDAQLAAVADLRKEIPTLPSECRVPLFKHLFFVVHNVNPEYRAQESRPYLQEYMKIAEPFTKSEVVQLSFFMRGKFQTPILKDAARDQAQAIYFNSRDDEIGEAIVAEFIENPPPAVALIINTGNSDDSHIIERIVNLSDFDDAMGFCEKLHYGNMTCGMANSLLGSLAFVHGFAQVMSDPPLDSYLQRILKLCESINDRSELSCPPVLRILHASQRDAFMRSPTFSKARSLMELFRKNLGLFQRDIQIEILSDLSKFCSESFSKAMTSDIAANLDSLQQFPLERLSEKERALASRIVAEARSTADIKVIGDEGIFDSASKKTLLDLCNRLDARIRESLT